jgi:hypothetical protein
MILKVPYGKDGHIEAEIDESRIAGIIEPNEVKIGDESACKSGWIQKSAGLP